MDRRGVFGLCTAWNASQIGRAEGEAENSTAFVWLRQQGDAENQTVEDYCTAQQPPTPSQAGGILEMIGAPVAIRGEPEDIPRGRPDGIPPVASEWTSGGEPGAGEWPEGAPEGTYPGANTTEGAEREPYDDNVSTRTEPAPEQTYHEAPADGYVIPDANNENPPANSTQGTPSSGGNETTPQDAPQGSSSAGTGETTPTRSGP